MNSPISQFISTEINGATRVLGILAHPTDHVKAPPGINRIARERGRDAIMVPFNVAPSDLGKCIDALRQVKNFDGAVITVPHKQAVIPYCDEITSHARAVGAVNIIRRTTDGTIIGGQLDGIGFVEGLRSAGHNPSGKSIYLVGGGGAASAIAFALAEADVRSLTLFNRSPEKVEAIRERLLVAYGVVEVRIGSSDPGGNDIVINATTLGMKASDHLPLDITKLTSDMVVAEVIMEPEMTLLLEAAARAGSRIHLGQHMLENQLKLMADFMGL